MKRIQLLQALLVLAICFGACKKNDADNPINPSNPGTTAGVYYVDSAKLYSTSLTGTNRRLITGLDTTNVNSYIGSAVRSYDGNKIFFLHYISGASQQIKLYSVNTDGTGLTMIKNMQTGGNEYVLLRATADNRIAFYQVMVGGGAVTTSLQTINSDGTGQASLATIPSGSPLVRFVSTTLGRWAGVSFGGSMMVKSGLLSNGSFGLSSDVAAPVGAAAFAMSADGNRIAWAEQSGNTLNVKMLDLVSSATTTVFSHTIVSDIGAFATYTVGLRWMSGADKLALYYGKFTTPSGSPNDFTQVVIYNRTDNTQASWRINGDLVQNLVIE